MTDRAHLYRVITDSQGNVNTNSLTVSVYLPGTTTLIPDLLYTADTGSTVLTNPFALSTGIVDFYLSTPQRVDLKVDDGTKTATYPGVDVLEVVTAIEAVNTVAASGASQTLPASTVATMHYVTLTANCTLTFPTPVAGASLSLFLTQDATGSRTVTWDAAVRWPGGSTPILTTTAAKTDAFSFVCPDGAHWYGFVAGQAL